MAEVVESIQWMCGVCRYVYDPDTGDPKNSIPPGTPFEELLAMMRLFVEAFKRLSTRFDFRRFKREEDQAERKSRIRRPRKRKRRR